MTPIARLTVLALALTACNKNKDTDPDDTGIGTTDDTITDTGDTTTTPPTVFETYDDANLSIPATIVALSYASAPQAYFTPWFAALSASLASDPKCPVETVDGETTTWMGGCTDTDGIAWVGRAAVTETKVRTTFVFDGFGYAGDVPCTAVGTVADRLFAEGTSTMSNDDGTFDVAMSGVRTVLDLDACTATRYDYLLEYSGWLAPLGKSATVWNGSGRFAEATAGRAHVQTVAEVTDNGLCDTEALSGSTILTTPGHQAVVSYDGAHDCSPDATATWQLDGVDRGEIAGITCSTTSGGGGAMLLLTSMLLVRRRRRGALPPRR